MDSTLTTPPSHHKSASRLALQITDSPNKTPQIPLLSLDIVPSCSSPKSPIPSKPTPMRELLLLSPSPMRKSRTRLTERLELLADPTFDPVGSRKRCKTRGNNVQMNLMGCASPRNNNRRQRRRAEMETISKEDKELNFVVEEVVKVRKRRQAGGTRSKKEKISLDASNSTQSLPRTTEGDGSSLDQLGLLITDLIMWNDIAKSSLWFGFGSVCFLSSCFTKGIGFSIFSAISQLGLLFLGLSFLSNSISHRAGGQTQKKFKLTEEDILRAARLVLPAVNLVLSNMAQLFSGEPSMTLKVAPFLLVGADYGHLITLRRLFALGFFVSFTAPKLYSNYDVQINKKADCLRRWVIEAWGACTHKKIVATSVVTAFWNLSSIRTRFFTAFMCLVVLRYHRQGNMVVNAVVTEVEEIMEQVEEQQDKQALVVAEQ